MSAPTPSLRFPPPPTTAATKSDPAATLTWLQDRLATIYSAGSSKPFQHQHNKHPKLTRAAYLDFYTTAHNYCHITKLARGAPPVGSLSGGDLYRSLEIEIRKFCAEARGQILGQEKGSEVENARRVVEEYMVQWRRLQYLAGLITNLLQPLEKDWVQGAIAEKQKSIHLLRDLHSIVWKETILQVGVDSTVADTGSVIAKAVATLRGQAKQESVSEENDGVVEVFVDNLRKLGVTLGYVVDA
jgi:hypothetical protein